MCVNVFKLFDAMLKIHNLERAQLFFLSLYIGMSLYDKIYLHLRFILLLLYSLSVSALDTQKSKLLEILRKI